MSSLLTKFFLCAASILFGLLFLEAGLRMLYPTPFGFVKGGVIADEELCYRLPTNFSAVVNTFSPPYKTTYTTTPFGSRTAGTYQEGLPTILMLGDSFTLGIQVQDDETFAARTAQNLNAKETNVNVLNYGTLGYNSFQYLFLLNRTITQFSVRYVVVNFYVSNDFVLPEDNPRKNCVMTVIHGYLVSADWENKSLFFKIRTFFHHHTNLYNFISNQIARSMWIKKILYHSGFAVNKVENTETLLFAHTNKSQEYYQTTFSLLDEINQLSREHNATMILMLIPSKYHMNTELWKKFWQKNGGETASPDVRIPFERMKNYARENNIAVVDLYEVFVQDSHPDKFFGVRDDHYNTEGHEKHAEEIIKIITEQQMKIIQNRKQKNKPH